MTKPDSDILMADSEVERGQQMEQSDSLLLQYAIEALEHAVQWDGIAHLEAEKAKALLDELARLRSEVERLANVVVVLRER